MIIFAATPLQHSLTLLHLAQAVALGLRGSWWGAQVRALAGRVEDAKVQFPAQGSLVGGDVRKTLASGDPGWPVWTGTSDLRWTMD